MNKIQIENHDFYYLDSDDPVISNLKTKKLYGLSNYILLKHFSQNAQGWIIDCGAHIGTFSFVPAIEQNKILLIEAATQNYECLELTFKHFTNAIIEKAIVLDKKQNCNFSSDYGPFGSPVLEDSGSEQSTTIDEICNKHNIDSVSMIKIDIEGFEEEAIIGAQDTINKNKPIMLLEINGHCLRIRNKKPLSIFQKIEDMNYFSFIINGNILIPINKNDKFPFCVTDVLCIHRDNIHKYIGFCKISDQLSNDDIEKILEHNYAQSNEDCKKYFQTIV